MGGRAGEPRTMLQCVISRCSSWAQLWSSACTPDRVTWRQPQSDTCWTEAQTAGQAARERSATSLSMFCPDRSRVDSPAPMSRGSDSSLSTLRRRAQPSSASSRSGGKPSSDSTPSRWRATQPKQKAWSEGSWRLAAAAHGAAALQTAGREASRERASYVWVAAEGRRSPGLRTAKVQRTPARTLAPPSLRTRRRGWSQLSLRACHVVFSLAMCRDAGGRPGPSSPAAAAQQPAVEELWPSEPYAIRGHFIRSIGNVRNVVLCNVTTEKRWAACCQLSEHVHVLFSSTCSCSCSCWLVHTCSCSCSALLASTYMFMFLFMFMF
jgi:hypothetical protein